MLQLFQGILHIQCSSTLDHWPVFRQIKRDCTPWQCYLVMPIDHFQWLFHLVWCFLIFNWRTCVLGHNRISKVSFLEFLKLLLQDLIFHLSFCNFSSTASLTLNSPSKCFTLNSSTASSRNALLPTRTKLTEQFHYTWQHSMNPWLSNPVNITLPTVSPFPPDLHSKWSNKVGFSLRPIIKPKSESLNYGRSM